MGGDFAPGSAKFWIFPALATPLVLLTNMVFYTLSRLARNLTSFSSTGVEAGHKVNETREPHDEGYHEGPEYSRIFRKERLRQPARGMRHAGSAEEA